MKKFLFLSLVVVGVVATVLVLRPTAKKVNAQATSRPMGRGYYTNTFESDPFRYVSSPTRFDAYGFPAPTWTPGGGIGGLETAFTSPDPYLNMTQYINLIRDMLNDTSWGACMGHIPVGTPPDATPNGNLCVQRKMGMQWASYIINTQLGVPASQFDTCNYPVFVPTPDPWDNYFCGVDYAKTNFTRWETTIGYYAAQGWIQWHAPVNFAANHFNTINGWYGEDSFWFTQPEPEFAWSIVFNNPPTAANPAGSQYIIKKWCGNVTGEATPLVGPPGGDFIQADCSFVRGWAYDPKNYSNNYNVRIKVYRDALPAFGGLQVADIPATDVGPAGQDPYPGGYLSGRHGFNANISAFQDSLVHNYYVYAQATNVFGVPTGAEFPLTNSPRQVGPCLTPVCSSLVMSPARPEPGEPFSVTVGISSGAPPGTPMNVKLNFPPGVFAGQSQFNWVTPTITFNGLIQNTPGRYMVPNLWTVTIGAVPPLNCPGTYEIGAKPYTKIYGDDIQAGGSFANAAGTCGAPANAGAGLYAYSNLNGPNYVGTSAQYAAIALGPNSGFATGGMRNGYTGPAPPQGLAFGNSANGSSLVGGNYGGNSGMAQCVPNYFSKNPGGITGAAAHNISGAPGAVLLSGGVRLFASQPLSGARAIYVDGDAYIDSNIDFATGYTDTTMPSLYIIVRGNLYISASVTRIAGVFVAQPNGASGGTIFTCGNGLAAVPAAQLYNLCGNPLTINGSFIANQVKLLRTRGTLRNSASNEGYATTQAAEIFKAGPEIYMARPDSTLMSGAAQSYDAITSLPPIL